MRCLALAQAWQDAGGEVIFATAGDVRPLRARLRAEGIEVVRLMAEAGSPVDARACAALAEEMDARWIVADGYHFQRDYQRVLRQSGRRLLLIDDYGSAGAYSVDLVLNQNLSAREELYERRDADTELLLGTRYTLLRREFAQWLEWERSIPPAARKLLVTLGGSDPDNVTRGVIEALDRIAPREWDIVVVVGGSNPHCESLKAAVQTARARFHLKHNVADMPDWMAWADLAISAGGSTTWELCCLGVPTVLIVLADNQEASTAAVARTGCMESIGRWEPLRSPDQLGRLVRELADDASRRQAMSVAARRLVDGQGAGRVVERLMAAADQRAEVVA